MDKFKVAYNMSRLLGGVSLLILLINNINLKFYLVIHATNLQMDLNHPQCKSEYILFGQYYLVHTHITMTNFTNFSISYTRVSSYNQKSNTI